MSEYYEYYITNYLHKVSHLFINTKIGKKLQDVVCSRTNKKLKNSQKICEIICKDYKFLTKYNYYDKSININEPNVFTVFRVNVELSDSVKNMAKKVLENILNTKKIILNNKPVQFKDCVILDVIDAYKSIYSNFHTDLEYNDFTGNAFNVWYLIKNNKNYGNIFLLQSDDYKKEYTPCRIKTYFDNESLSKYNKNKSLELYKNSLYSSFSGKETKVGTLKNYKIVYADIKNGDCLVMSKHILHDGDIRRNGNVHGFNFRVLVKNDDGSIDYNKYYKASKKFPNHKWDRENKKIFGVKLLDFV